MPPDIEHISFPPSCSVSNEADDVPGERPYSALTAFSGLTCECSFFKRFAIPPSTNPESKLAIAGND
jgi:hypothetical protein